MNLLFANDRQGAYPPSWYAETAEPLDRFAPLEGAQRADVVVIGAGYTGLTAALYLSRAGMDVHVLDAHRIGFGASGRNGGQIHSGLRQDQEALSRRYGADTADALWQVSEDAKAEVIRLIDRHEIRATFKPGTAAAYRSRGEADHARRYMDHLAARYGYDKNQFLGRDEIRNLIGSEAFTAGVIDWGAGHLHPLRYALGLARAAKAAGAHFYEKTTVTGISGDTLPVVTTDRGRITANYVIVAAGGYAGPLSPYLGKRIMPINNFIATTEPLGDLALTLLARSICVADDRHVVSYWRMTEDRRLLFGGGETYGWKFPEDIPALVRKPLLSIYPQLAKTRISHAWGGTLGITRNRLPVFARLAPTVLTAAGFSGQGVALATLAGRLLGEAVIGSAARFDLMASLNVPPLPGPAGLQETLMRLGLTWYRLRDRLGL